MSQGRADNRRDTISLRRRPGLQRVVPKKEVEKPKDLENPKEKEKDGEKEKEKGEHESPPAGGGRGIRTRLSTGSIHMNGTYTIAVAKEIENNQSLMYKDMDQAAAGRFHDSWTADEKLRIMDFAEKFGNRAAGRRFNVSEFQIRNWKKLEDDLETMPINKRANRETTVQTSPSSCAAATAVTATSGSGRKRCQAGTVEGIHAQGLVGQTIPPKRRKIGRNDGSGEDNRNDYFCWLCHKEGTVICCELCPRVYHTKCLNLGQKLPKDWVCPECEKIMRAECIDTRSKAMSMISIDTLCTLLKYALERMTHQGSDPFMKPVDLSAVPYYTDYIYNAMDLGQLERNIKKKLYGCTEAFLADAKWILHNCIIFNGTHHKLTSSAKMIIKICKHEMNEIELCPDCYWNSCVRKNDEWFSETCRTPHTLVWAKLKGYPFWPAKALREEDDQVDVRFFGAHDRSWVPTSQVYMLSKDIPTPAKNKRGGFENAMEELEIHIQKIREKFGHFEYASFRMPYDKNHVYFHNKMKQPFRKGRQAANSAKLAFSSPKQKSYTAKHMYPGKTESPTKSDRQLVMLKTADAVRSKYNSMITTRRVTSDTAQNRTDVKASTKTELSIGQPNSVPVKVIPTKVTPGAVVPRNLIKVVLPATNANTNTFIVKQGDIERKVIFQPAPVNQATVNIVDKVQDKIKQMNADSVEDDAQDDAQVAAETHLQSGHIDGDKNSDVCGEDMSVSKSDSDRKDLLKDLVISEETLEEKSNTDAASDLFDKMETEDCEPARSREGSTSPSKKVYLENLRKTIQSCKEKLGLSDELVFSADEVEEEEDEENQEDEEKGNVCNENEKDSVVMEIDDSLKVKSATSSSDDKTTNVKNDEKSNDSVIHLSVDLQKTVKDETEKQPTGSSCGESASETTDVQTQERSEGVNEENVDQPGDRKIDQQEETANEKRKVESERGLDNQVSEHCKDLNDPQQDKGKEISEQDKKEESDIMDKKPTSSEKIIHDLNQRESVLEQTSESKTSDLDSKDTAVSKQSMLVPDKMDVEEQGLVMEVESDSDPDQLVMDLDREKQKTKKKRTPIPSKERVDIMYKYYIPPDTSEKLQKRDLSGANKVVIVKQCSSDGENSSKSSSSAKSSPALKSPTVKSSDSRKSPVVSKPVPTAEFLQSAVEKTMKSPNSSMEQTMETEPEVVLESSSNTEPDPPAHSEIISKFTKKLMGSIQGTFEMMCSEFISQELQPKNVTKDLQAEIQKLRWEQHQQILELKHNFQLTMAEMKTCWEAEKQRIVSEVNSLNSKDKEKAINETKKKQWCANCGKEAIFYCCWNTSYCDYPCQQAHWPKHMPTCMQAQAQANEKEAADKDSQSTVGSSPSAKSLSQDQTQEVKVGSKSGTGNVVSSSQANTPALGSGESPIDVEMERPQQWDQSNVQPLPRQDITPYVCLPPQQPVPSPGAVQVPQGTLQFTPVVPGPGAVSPINQEQLKKKTTCHGWSEQSMAEAYNAVMTGGMSVNKAAKVFQVPRIRLADRIAALGKAAQFPAGNGGQQIPQGTTCNPQMLSGSSHSISSQPILQYVQNPQPIISLPPSSLPVQQFTPQMGMQTVQVQGQPTPTGLVQNQQAIVQNRSLLQPNSSVLFPMNVAGGVVPGNLVFSQSGPRPYQLPRPY